MRQFANLFLQPEFTSKDKGEAKTCPIILYAYMLILSEIAYVQNPSIFFYQGYSFLVENVKHAHGKQYKGKGRGERTNYQINNMKKVE